MGTSTHSQFIKGQRINVCLDDEEIDSIEFGRGISQEYRMPPRLSNLKWELLKQAELAEFGDFNSGEKQSGWGLWILLLLELKTWRGTKYVKLVYWLKLWGNVTWKST